MTDARLKRLNGAIERAMRLARAECSSNRLQNNIDKVMLEMKRIERNQRNQRKK